MSINQTTRIDWIDTAKGLGILLVVAGHALAGGTLYSAIYLFHMPMFFILSGLVFRPENLRMTLQKRIRSLMLPYASFVLIVMLMRNVLQYRYGLDLVPIIQFDMRHIAWAVEGGKALVGDFGTFWFVSCLFLSLLFYSGLRSVIRNPLSTVMILTMTAFLLVSYPLSKITLPWCANVVPLATFFLWIGECWPIVFKSGKVHADSAGLVITSAIVAAIGFICFASFDMKYGRYGTPILSTVAAVAISHLFFLCCIRLTYVPLLRGALTWLGQATLVILFLHRFFVLYFHGRISTIATIVVATLIPFVVWLMIRKSPSPIRQALLGERPSRWNGRNTASSGTDHG